MDDRAIFQKAKERKNVIILSKDTDFSELISRLGSPPKLMNIKLGNCDNKTLWSLMKPNVKQILDILINTEIDIVDID